MANINGFFGAEQDFVRDAEAAANVAFATTLAEHYSANKTVKCILSAIIFALKTNTSSRVYGGCDNLGYEYNVTVSGNVAKVYETRESYENFFEVKITSIEEAADALKYLFG